MKGFCHLMQTPTLDTLLSVAREETRYANEIEVWERLAEIFGRNPLEED